MSNKKQKNFVVISGLSTHTNSIQTVDIRHLSYKKLKSWAYTTYDIHPTTSIEETVRLLNANTNWTITEIVEPAAEPVRMQHAV